MLPALVAIATYNRLEFTKECIQSLFLSATNEEIEIFIFDNGSTDGTAEWLDKRGWENLLRLKSSPEIKGVFLANQNLGTARAINHVWSRRKPGQSVIKLDNDVTFNQNGWASRMAQVLKLVPAIGQVGLKRSDLAERAFHPQEEVKTDPGFRSQLFELANLEVVEIVNHVMGTCVMFSPKAIASMGDLYQMQDIGNTYGFDDSFASLRLRLLGFQCAHLRGRFGDPLTINHIDQGEGGTPENGEWTRAKAAHAGEWMSYFNQTKAEFESGQREPYWKDSDVSVTAVTTTRNFDEKPVS